MLVLNFIMAGYVMAIPRSSSRDDSLDLLAKRGEVVLQKRAGGVLGAVLGAVAGAAKKKKKKNNNNNNNNGQSATTPAQGATGNSATCTNLLANVGQLYTVMGLLDGVTRQLGANSPITGNGATASSGNASITNGQINLANQNTYEVAVAAAGLGLNAASACSGYAQANAGLATARAPWQTTKPLVRAQQLAAGVNNLGVTDNSAGNGNTPFFANGTAITQNMLAQIAPGAQLLTNIVTNPNNNYNQMIQQIVATANQQGQTNNGNNNGNNNNNNNNAKKKKKKKKGGN